MVFDMATPVPTAHSHSGLHSRLPLLPTTSGLVLSVAPCSLYSPPRLLLSARWKQRTLEAYSGGKQQLDGRGKRGNIFSFVVCGLCGNHTTLAVAPRQPSTAQPLGVVPAQILFPQANNTVEVWTCFRGGLSINIPVAMVAASPCNMSVRLRSLSVK